LVNLVQANIEQAAPLRCLFRWTNSIDMTRTKILLFAVALAGALALPATAHDHGRGGHHYGGYRPSYGGYHYGGGPHFSFGFGIGAPLFYPSPYYGSYYSYSPYVYRAVPAPEVAVGRQVAVEVQQVLARNGYYHGPIDGDLGLGSRAAIRRWQADRGLPVTGLLDSPTLRSMGL
jgi:hypothetical protein